MGAIKKVFWNIVDCNKVPPLDESCQTSFIVRHVFLNSLCNLFRNWLWEGGQRKLEFHTAMRCICKQFCYSKVLKSEPRNSTTTKAELFCDNSGLHLLADVTVALILIVAWFLDRPIILKYYI